MKTREELVKAVDESYKEVVSAKKIWREFRNTQIEAYKAVKEAEKAESKAEKAHEEAVKRLEKFDEVHSNED